MTIVINLNRPYKQNVGFLTFFFSIDICGKFCALNQMQKYTFMLNRTTDIKYSRVCYNERCYVEQFLSIKSGSYNERGRILSADVARSCAHVGTSHFD